MWLALFLCSFGVAVPQECAAEKYDPPFESVAGKNSEE